MINKNYTSDIRTCERIKFDQALYILTMYEKKIRKNRQSVIKKSVNQQKGVDADQQLQDITYAWKNKWKLDLTKPVLNCVTSVYPRILVDYGNHKSQLLHGFYFTLGKFIKRLRAQHEDETNYKFVLNSYDKTTMIHSSDGYYTNSSTIISNQQQQNDQQQKSQQQQLIYGDQQQKSQRERLKLLNCSKSAVNSVLNVCYNMANRSIKHFEQNFQYIINEDISDVDTQGLQWQVIRPLRFVREVTRRAIFGEKDQDDGSNQQHNEQQMQQQNQQPQPQYHSNKTLQPQSQQASQLMIFAHNTIKIMQRIKQSQHGSTLITIQPQIKQLTYIIHPLLMAIYAMFKKQNLQKQKDIDWRQGVPIETTKFMDNVKNSYNFSKIVFINLDGYESQFNLQLVRNFKKHLLYVSFPKEQAILNDLQKVYSKRFFKKLMFRYTQAMYQSYPAGSLSEDMRHIAKLQQLNFNPENYHYFTQQMYNNNQRQQDINQNMYIFPIRYKGLKENFPQLFEESQKQDIEQYESYFIKFVMRDFIINQIREFNPSYIMISYSGRLTIEDSHFVEMVQELTKVGNYKLVMYPNMTTGFCTEEMMVVEDKDGNECDYDGGVGDDRVRGLLEACMSNKGSRQQQQTMMQDEQQQQQQLQMIGNTNTSSSSSTSILQMFNKLARFLKVSSGTYNLTRTSQQDPLISKFKNQFILTYTDELMTTLGKEYYSIDRIRFKNKDLSIIPKLFEQNLNAIKKSFTKTVPEFYNDLYKVLEMMLFSSNNNNSNESQNTNNNSSNRNNQQLLTSYGVDIKQYQHDIQQLWQQLTKSSSIEISSYQQNHSSHHQLIRSQQVTSNNYLMMMSEQSSSSQQQIHNISSNSNNSKMQQKKDLVEQIQQLKIIKNRRQFLSLKQLHFIQISSEKYDDKVSIYIKKNPQSKQFTTISQQSQQTQGLYDVTFLRKDKTQLKLFQTTKILYKTNQQQRESNTIPIMVMNNLSDQKPGYFENYMADLDVSEELNKERKNIQEKKALVIPIVLKQEDNKIVNMKSFLVRSQWNFYQTRQYIVIYWPTQFDYLRAIIYKMLNKTYSPSISPTIYIAKKSFPERHVFKRVNVMSQTTVIPRMGCSAYEFQSRLFVFGGFYAKQMNYLQFQHDVTMIDLTGYGEENKIRVQNLKGVLYSQDNFNRQLAHSNTYNSYIRPRMEFEIYDKTQLADWYHDSPQYKSIILFGGYGQNFLRPFSLLTYYYYEIKFSRETRNIISIHKKIIYDKTVPINVKEMTKNLGVIKTNKKNPNTNVLQTNKITQPGSYLTFRNCFKIEKNSDNSQDFKYKFRYMFAQDEHKTFKTEIKKVQQQRTEQFDSSSITVEKMQGNNHLISLQKDGKKCVICLHLQIPHQKAKKLGCSREVKLTHQSIVYIDFWNSMICAIIRHQLYTRGKSVLVEYNIKSLENLSFNHDQIPHIALTWMKEFDYNLTRHILIACNKNTIAILHGQKLLNSQKIKEFIVKKKKNKTQAIAYEIQERQQISLVSLPNPQYCTSIFFKQRNKILCLQYLSDSRNSLIIEVAYEIELNSANDVYSWQAPSERGDKGQSGRQGQCVTCYRVVTEGTKMAVGWHKMVIVQYFKVQKDHQSQANKNKRPTQRIIQVIYNKKPYYLELGGLGMSEKNSIQILQLISTQKLKFQKQSTEKGTILSKSISQYYEIL